MKPISIPSNKFSVIEKEKQKRLEEYLKVLQSKTTSLSATILSHLEIALQLATELKTPESQITLYFSAYRLFKQAGDFKQAEESMKQAEILCESINDLKRMVDAINNQAIISHYKGLPQRMIQLAKKSLEVGESLEYLRGVSMTYSLLGGAMRMRGKFDASLEYFIKGLEVAEKVKDEHIIGTFLNHIGTIYLLQKNHHKALTFFEKSFEKQQAMGMHSYVAQSLLNIGTAYGNLKEHNKSLIHYQKALEVYRHKAHDKHLETIVLLNIAMVYTFQKKFEKALALNYRALEMTDETRVVKDRINALCSLTKTYLAMKKPEKALEHLKEAEKITLDKQLFTFLMDVYALFPKCYEALEEYQRANVYYKKLLEIKDNNYNNEKAKVIAQLQVEYETAQKEKEIEFQKLALEKKELELQRKREVEEMNLQLESLVEDRTQQLLLQNKQLKQYAFIVAHDLKEPLSNLKGITELLLENYKSQMDATGQHFVEHIGQSAQYLNNLLEDLLIYATLSKESRLTCSTASPIQVLSEIQQALKNEIIAKQAKIKIGEMPAQLKINPKHLRLLFQNLLSNSLQFCRGNDTPLIHINASLQEDRYRFEIKDNGIGIALENQQKIFNVFYRLDKTQYEHTGIGLAICEKIVQLYNGQIGVESSLCKGSTFYFTLST